MRTCIKGTGSGRRGVSQFSTRCFSGPRISCHAALERTAYAPFRKERRMKFANAIKFHRKSGLARQMYLPGGLLALLAHHFFSYSVTGKPLAATTHAGCAKNSVCHCGEM